MQIKKNKLKPKPKTKTGSANFKSAKTLFKNKAGHLNWDNTEMRDRKAEARTRTIEDLQGLPNQEGKLRTLTLCGENLVHEQMMLDTTDLSKRFEELVCLEGDTKVHQAAKRRLNLFPVGWKKKIKLIQAEDKQVLITTSGYKTNGKISSARKLARVTLGFDLIWLDWMNSFGVGVEQTIGLLCDNISVFERAWAKGNPGLLYLTLACCKEEKADLASLHLALSSFQKDYKQQGMATDLFNIRYYGLGALLNHKLQTRGVVAKPTHGLFYRENKTHAMTMFFAGFEIVPTKRTGKLPRFPEPEYLGIQNPAER